MNDRYILTDENIEKIRNKKPRVEGLKEPSELFMECLDDISYHSSQVISCEMCDRLYFMHRGDYEEGELDYYKKCMELNPEMYIETDEYTPWIYLNAMQYVWECKCNGPSKIETFILGHKELIVDFLRKRLKRIQEIADREMKLMNRLENLSEYDGKEFV